MDNFKYDIAKGFQRTNDFPLDKSSVFTSLQLAKDYVDGKGKLGKTSYLGQVLAVVENNEVHIYKIGFNTEEGKRELQELGGILDREVVIGNITIPPGTPIADVLEMLDEIITTTDEIMDGDGDVIVPTGTTINESLELIINYLLDKISSAGVHAEDIIGDGDTYVEQAGEGKVKIGVHGISNDTPIVLDRERTVTIHFGGEIGDRVSESTWFDDVEFENLPETPQTGGVWKLSTTSYAETPEDETPEWIEPGHSVKITNLLDADTDNVEITATAYYPQ